MRTERVSSSDLIRSDLKDFAAAAKNLANHSIKLAGLGFGTTFLEWLAALAAMYALLFLFRDLFLRSALALLHYSSVWLFCLLFVQLLILFDTDSCSPHSA